MPKDNPGQHGIQRNLSFYGLSGPIRITAHRGDSSHEHENTVAAFESAIKSGADAIELDLRRTADGVIVVHHDSSIAKLGESIRIMNLPEAQATARVAGFELPTFEEVLKLCRGRVVADIELKEGGYESEVLDTTARLLTSDGYVFRSFADSVVARLKQLSPETEAGLIIGSRIAKIKGGFRSFVPLARRLKHCNADFVSPHWKLVNRRFISKMRKLDCPVVPWTVDNEMQAVKFGRIGVSGIVTNDPGKIKRAIDP